MLRFLLFFGLILNLAACTSLGGRDPEQADLHLRVGSSLLENGSYPQAMTELLKAEQLDPESAVIQNNLGLVYFAREKNEMAEKHIRRAIRLDPTFTEAKNNLGRVLTEKSEFAAAEKILKEALQDLTFITPEKIHLNLGYLSFRQGRYREAKGRLLKAIEFQRSNCMAQTLYGRSLFELKDFSAAAASLDRAIGFCQRGTLDEPQYYSALAYYQLGDARKAEVRLEEITKLYSNGKYYDRARSMLETMRR
ncbi:MAG: tetratricopeptide repeat protein [Bdellovibrio sp.]|jgi:type IV pilus assembly protein PilF